MDIVIIDQRAYTPAQCVYLNQYVHTLIAGEWHTSLIKRA